MTNTASVTEPASFIPSIEEMLEMLNVDILPFFDGYDEATFSFSEMYRATALASENGDKFNFTLNTGTEISISKSYFRFPGAEKDIVLFHLKNTLS